MAFRSSNTPTLPPKRIGSYRIADRLGSGGMGEVFRAWDESLERWVAMKHILPRHLTRDTARERLLREAKTVARLSHPTIVQIHDLLEPNRGDVWIVMELVDGETLHRLIAQGELTLGRLVRVAVQVAQGLAEAHGKEVIHRDLKTENIMVTDAGQAKILDFGLAKQLGEDFDGPSLSQTGALPGTGRAMSPEQAMGERLDPRTDLFSFGSLLYEALAGAPPFLGTSFVHSLSQVCTFQPPPLQKVNPSVPEPLSILVERLLEKDPAQRPQRAAEVARILQQIEEGLSSQEKKARMLDTADRTLLEATAEMSQSGFTDVSEWQDSHIGRSRATSLSRRGLRRTRRRSRRILFTAFAVLALVLIGRLFYLESQRETIPDFIERDSVAVLPFLHPQETEGAWLDLALAELLAAELEIGDELRVLSGEEVFVMIEDLQLPPTATLADDTLRNVRQYLSTRYVIRGSYLVSSGETPEIRVVARLQDARNGQLLLSASETWDADEWPSAVGGIADLFRDQLFQLKEVDPAEREAVRTAFAGLHPAARDAYDRGLRLLWEQRDQEALQALQESSSIHRDAVATADAAADAADAATSISDLPPLLARIRALVRLGRTTQARELLEDVASRSAAPDMIRRKSAVDAALLQTDAVARPDLLRDVYRATPDDLRAGEAWIAALLEVGRYAEAESALAEVRRLPSGLGDDPRWDLLEASLAAEVGAAERRRAALKRAETIAESRGRRDLLVEALLRRAQLFRQEAALAEAGILCDRALSASGEAERFLPRIWSEQAQLALESGNPEEARDLYRKIRELETVSRQPTSTPSASTPPTSTPPASTPPVETISEVETSAPTPDN